MSNTYWNHNGLHQSLAEALQALIPWEGSVANPRGKNRRLERFRRAVNCYYDLYNNGLGNRAAEFRTLFGIAPSHYRMNYSFRYSDSLYRLTEAKMDELILEAAAEQGIEIPATKELAAA